MTHMTAFVFPGQGSQSVGMLGALALNRSVRDTFTEASDVLGYDVWALIQQGPLAVLNQTERTQPVLLVAGVAVWRCWMGALQSAPLLLAGHSLGEYTALVCAGSLTLSAAVLLVAERGRLMQGAVSEGVGTMAAILGLDEAQVEQACIEAEQSGDGMVAPANYNAPGQVVVAGHCQAVERALLCAKALGAKRTIRLPVSVPSHCLLMRAAADQFASVLEQVPLTLPTIPILHNVDVREHRSVQAIREALCRQLYRPVRWVETIQAMVARGITTILECGPGTVLSGLNKRIAPALHCDSLLQHEALLCP